MSHHVKSLPYLYYFPCHCHLTCSLFSLQSGYLFQEVITNFTNSNITEGSSYVSLKSDTKNCCYQNIQLFQKVITIFL